MMLVTGANGQLGSELRNLLGASAVYVDRETLDISDETAVRNYLKTNRFDCIINCAAYTAVDRAEDEPVQANAVNHLGSLWLAKYGKRIIHISTDYVFDGTSHVPYHEEDKTNPLSIYGKTKLAGEKAVLDYAETAVVLRTAWVYSPYGSNFVKNVLRMGRTRESLQVVSDQIGSPTSAGDLAKSIIEILPQMKAGKKDVYHFTNEGVCSWYDLAVAVMDLAGLPTPVIPIETRDFPTKAVRPFYSVLSKKKIKTRYGLGIRHWREALGDVMKKINDRNH